MHNFDKMQWMETFYADSTKTTQKKQILKMSAQLDKSFSKYLFSKAKMTRFVETSFELKVTEILNTLRFKFR